MIAYEDSDEFRDFKTKTLTMDKDRLESDREFIRKGIFFTDRAAKRETPGGDRSMHNQLARLQRQEEFITEVLNQRASMRPKPKKAKRGSKKRR